MGVLLDASSLLFIHVHLFCVFWFAVIKQEEMQPIKLESTEVKEQMYCKSPPFNNRVSTITTVIKSEIRNAEAPRNSVSVVMAPSAVTKEEINKVEEAERAVVKSIQQAKIPLKKRELKLAESYHSNHHTRTNSSSIIVCNPSVTQTKDSHGREGNVSDSAVAAQTSSQLQQALLTTRQEPPPQALAHREGQNGVIGAVGHVGVICGPAEHHRALSARLEEQNRSCSEARSSRAVEDEREVRRQTVLVRKEVAEKESVALTATEIDVHLPKPDRPEITEKQLDSVDVSLLKHSSEVTNQQRAEREDPLDTSVKTEPSSHQQKSHIQTLEEPAFESVITDTPAKQEPKKDPKEQETKAADTCGAKDSGLESEEKRWPPDKAFSELQKEGIRLKIKIPPQRRNKFKGKADKQEKESKQDVQDEGTPLRRSARICRCVCVTVETIHIRHSLIHCTQTLKIYF